MRDIRDSAIPEASDEAKLQKSLRVVKGLNRAAVLLGMTSFGFLSMLITHRSMREQNYSLATTLIVDGITFITAITGKSSIVIYFLQPTILALAEQTIKHGLLSNFTLKNMTPADLLLNGIKYLLALNTSLFWAGLSHISFIQSGDLLQQYDLDSTKEVGKVIKSWYVFAPFVLCALYSNCFSWPGIHQGGFLQIKAFLSWLLESKEHRNVRLSLRSLIMNNHNSVLKELKREINLPDDTRQRPLLTQTPHLDGLLVKLRLEEQIPADTQPIDKLIGIIEALKTKSIPAEELRAAYIEMGTLDRTPSMVYWHISRGIALAIAALTTVGFINAIGIHKMILTALNLPKEVINPAAYLCFYSMIAGVLLSVYPMVVNILSVPTYGFPQHVFSNYKLAAIYFAVIFVGVCSGLANGEQSVLDKESARDVVLATGASFLLDAWGIYMVMRWFFEDGVRNDTTDENLLSRHTLKLQEHGDEAVRSIDDLNYTQIQSMMSSYRRQGIFSSSALGSSINRDTEQQSLMTIGPSV